MSRHECCEPRWGWEEEHHHHPGPVPRPFFPFGWSHCCCCSFGPRCGGQGEGPGIAAPFGFVRRFRSKKEKIAELEAYLEALKKEALAVEEKLRCLREDED